jgi:hypothetical protein
MGSGLVWDRWWGSQAVSRLRPSNSKERRTLVFIGNGVEEIMFYLNNVASEEGGCLKSLDRLVGISSHSKGARECLRKPMVSRGNLTPFSIRKLVEKAFGLTGVVKK